MWVQRSWPLKVTRRSSLRSFPQGRSGGNTIDPTYTTREPQIKMAAARDRFPNHIQSQRTQWNRTDKFYRFRLSQWLAFTRLMVCPRWVPVIRTHRGGSSLSEYGGNPQVASNTLWICRYYQPLNFNQGCDSKGTSSFSQVQSLVE